MEEAGSGINPVTFQCTILDLESDIRPSNAESFIKTKEAEEGYQIEQI
jgi:hypothetical protein